MFLTGTSGSMSASGSCLIAASSEFLWVGEEMPIVFRSSSDIPATNVVSS